MHTATEELVSKHFTYTTVIKMMQQCLLKCKDRLTICIHYICIKICAHEQHLGSFVIITSLRSDHFLIRPNSFIALVLNMIILYHIDIQ